MASQRASLRYGPTTASDIRSAQELLGDRLTSSMVPAR